MGACSVHAITSQQVIGDIELSPDNFCCNIMIMNLKNYAVILFISLVVVLMSVHIPQTVYNKTDLVKVRCGWPLGYMIQDQSWRDPPYPWRTNCGFFALEEPYVVFWPQLLSDVLVVFLGISFLVMLASRARVALKGLQPRANR